VSTPRGEPGRDLDSIVLDALFAGSTVGLYVLDTDLRIVRRSASARDNPTFPSATAEGRPLWELSPGLDSAAIERALREVLETGRPRREVEFLGRSVMPPHRRIAVSASMVRLEDDQGKPLGLAVSTVDITDRYRSRRHLELLERSGARLGLSMDVFEIARQLAELSVPGFADGVVVDVLDSVLRGEAPPPGPVFEDLPLRRAACHAQPAGAGVVTGRVGEMTSLPFGTPFSESLADLHPRLVSDLRAGGWFTPEVAARTGLAGDAHSLMVVPLVARDAIMGVAAFYRMTTPAPFDEQDLALAVDLGGRVAVGLDNARLYRLRDAAARLLQLTLRPAQVGSHLAVETARSYRPVGSGADWFDVIPLSGERVALVTGDTGGQGLRAVATMAELRATVSALATLDLPPGQVLARLHLMVSRMAEERAREHRDFPLNVLGEPGPGRPARRTARTTCLYAVYDPFSRACQIASAGHPPPALAYPDGTVGLVPITAGPPLGVGTERHETAVVQLPEGTVLALCNSGLLLGSDRDGSDGDGSDGDEPEPSSDRLLRALSAGGATLQDRCDAVFRALTPHRPSGDAVLLLARTRTVGPDRAASWSWPHDPTAVAKARAAVGDKLAEWGLDALVDDMVLVVSELATNAIRYATGRIEVRLICGEQTLTCEVSDDSTANPWLLHAEEEDESGRGMLITAQLTSRWGVRQTPEGKIIWVEQPIPQS
jgi:GAF domain-containing protein/anti-sigma regulatory factor (Ser/Thr protein kinase)